MSISEAYQLVANLDSKASLRRFAPQHGLVQFNSRGEVVSVHRFKTIPHEAEQHEALCRHPGCLQISTMPHWYKSPEELQVRINADLWLFSHMKAEQTLQPTASPHLVYCPCHSGVGFPFLASPRLRLSLGVGAPGERLLDCYLADAGSLLSAHRFECRFHHYDFRGGVRQCVPHLLDFQFATGRLFECFHLVRQSSISWSSQ